MLDRFSCLRDVIPPLKIDPLLCFYIRVIRIKHKSKTHGRVTLRSRDYVAGVNTRMQHPHSSFAADRTFRQWAIPTVSFVYVLIEVGCGRPFRYRPLVIGESMRRSIQREREWYGLEGWHWHKMVEVLTYETTSFKFEKVCGACDATPISLNTHINANISSPFTNADPPEHTNPFSFERTTSWIFLRPTVDISIICHDCLPRGCRRKRFLEWWKEMCGLRQGQGERFAILPDHPSIWVLQGAFFCMINSDNSGINFKSSGMILKGKNTSRTQQNRFTTSREILCWCAPNTAKLSTSTPASYVLFPRYSWPSASGNTPLIGF